MKLVPYVKKYPVFMFFLIIAIFLSVNKGLSEGDFDVYLNASERLIAGEDIYSPPHLNDLQYYYSPFFAMILAPTTFMPDSIVKILWLLLNSILIIRIWKLSSNHFDTSSLTIKKYNQWMAISIILMIMPVLLNFQALQMTIFMLWSIIESLYLFGKGKIILGSSVLALAINIKLLPLVVIPYLFYRKMYKPIIYVIAFFCIYLFLPHLILGYEYSSLLHYSWWETINPTNKEHVVEQGAGFYSISALIPAYFSDLSMDVPMNVPMSRPINIMSLSSTQISLIVNSIRLVLVLSMLIPLRSKLDKNFKGFLSLSYLCFLVPLIFPHQRGYSFFFMAPLIIFLTYYFLKDLSRITKKIFPFILFVISAILISPIWGRDIIGDYIEIYKDYKIIPIAALLLIPAFLIIVIRDEQTIHNNAKNLNRTES